MMCSKRKIKIASILSGDFFSIFVSVVVKLLLARTQTALKVQSEWQSRQGGTRVFST